MDNDLVISSRELSKEIAKRLEKSNIVLLDTNDGSKILLDDVAKDLLKQYYKKKSEEELKFVMDCHGVIIGAVR
ncbi:hypothetical protein [Clostridium perfringens]|uniref:hypothetical protein n=1 Tax=Clostridium perfringens TaxID=1502 RepID=UPI001B825CCE|nr:hypothetical protein [Clostridium perfringens]HBC2034833.1 hypothetical protein [Clostridium perfringens]HBC2057981.1 hypothetical protein [Clostridium perfringens]HBC2072184.1 hypothetical protein [Clostridium perfringens]